MKIAWFTPFYRNSAIGKYSQSITDELVRHCSVDLWVPKGEDNLLDTNLKVIRFKAGKDKLDMPRGYDCIIYNMGNYLDFHKDIYEMSGKVKAVVILHDFVMHHFFAGYYLMHLKDKNTYIREMSRLYGKEGERVASDSICGNCKQVWEADEVVKYPFFEKAIEGALGVIVHSRFFAEEVKKTFLGPVAVVYHPFYRYPLNIKEDRMGSKNHNDRVLMVTVGHVNPNKRIDKIIKVMGENKNIFENVDYKIIGPHNHEEYFSLLQALITKYDLRENVNFLGYQPDEILYSYMSKADVFVNLRFPAMEGASGSLVEQLYFGKPIMVTDTGFYSEIPDDCVVKASIDNEDKDIGNILKKLISDKDVREEIGERGKRFAVENFNVNKYCENFLKSIDSFRSYKPLLELTDKAGYELAIMKATANMETIERVAKEIYRIFKTNS